jgi:heat shock protein 5
MLNADVSITTELLKRTISSDEIQNCVGGEDFDQRVIEHFVKLYKKKTGKDLRKNNRSVQKLRREVEKAKRTLSTQHQARIEIEALYDTDDFSETLTRAKFEELNMVTYLCL